MSIYEVNRNTVNRRLALRREKREEAKREAADAAFLAAINEHGRINRAKKQAAEEAQRREEERRAMEAAQKAAEARRKKRLAQREASWCLYWYLYLAMVAAPGLCAAIVITLHGTGVFPLWFTVAFGIAACALSVYNFLAEAIWINWKAVRKFLSILWGNIKEYLFTAYAYDLR